MEFPGNDNFRIKMEQKKHMNQYCGTSGDYLGVFLLCFNSKIT